jgi:hypothetical protein
VDLTGLIFAQKKLRGFHLAKWFALKNAWEMYSVWKTCAELVGTGTLSSKISNVFEYEEAAEGIEYYLAN